MSKTAQIDTSWIKNGEICWIEKEKLKMQQADETAPLFLEAKITAFTQFSTKCQIIQDKSMVDIHPKRVYQRVPQEQRKDYADLVNMEQLNDGEVIYNLKKRYLDDQFQTYLGPTLLVINPFKAINHLYNKDVIKEYYEHIIIKGGHPLAYKEKNPHVYAITAECYRQLFENEKSQAIVISGESGAGKTVNAKHAMQFLTQISDFQISTQEKITGIKNKSIEDEQNINLQNDKNGIEQKILSCNPVLEAFGNSKTLMNDNSSRFGKYVTLIVEKQSRKIIGAKIISYLLEKSRIIKLNEGERGFHIFYHFIYGAKPETLEKYKLPKLIKGKPDYFNYLKGSNCYTVNTINDQQMYDELMEAFQIVNFTQIQIDTIFSIISAILQLGNLEFDQAQENEICDLKNPKTLETISQLLKIDSQQLLKSLTQKRRVQKQQKEEFWTPFKKEECDNNRDTLAKDLYSKLFSFLILNLNKTILPEGLSEQDLENQQKYLDIGLLDIYGFEVFAKNGFEQFFINYTNEKLQQLYIQYVFKEEQVVFKSENLEQHLKNLNFEDNQPVIDILNTGIFSALDENCKIVSNDQKLHNQLKEKLKAQKLVKFSKFSGNTNFTIIHTATDVQYDMEGFIEKNKDKIEETIIQTFTESNDEILQTIYQEQQDKQSNKEGQSPSKSNNNNRFSSTKFRVEMDNLMNTLMACDVSFIRCIKSNDKKQPNTWFDSLTINQIRYLGVLESIKVRRESYPIRRNYRIFYKRFGMLMDKHKSYPEYQEDPNTDYKLLTMDIFNEHFSDLQDNQRLFGKTKIFLRQETLNQIEKEFQKKTEKFQITAKKFQARYYRAKQLRKLRTYIQAAYNIRSKVKLQILGDQLIVFYNAATKLQNWIKKVLLKIKRKKLRQATINLQNLIKTQQMHQTLIKKRQAILVIQKQWKKSLIIQRMKKIIYFKKLIMDYAFENTWKNIEWDAAIFIQKNYRGYLTRKQNADKIIQIQLVVQILRENKAATKIQKIARGFIIRVRVSRIFRAASYIQGFMKMKWIRNLYINLRQSTIKIQVFMRKQLLISKIKSQQFNHYFLPLNAYIQKQKQVETQSLYNKNSSIQDSYIEKSHENLFNNKIYLFSYVLDLDIITDVTDIYEKYWSKYYLQLFKEKYDKINYLQNIQVGEAHTLSVSMTGKLNSFGWNDYGQLGIQSDYTQNSNNTQIQQQQLKINTINQIQGQTRTKMLSSGKNHNLILDASGQLYSWGLNDNGQLGLGNQYTQDHQSQLQKVHLFENKQIQSVKYIKASGNESFAVTENGQLFTWPWKINGKNQCVPFHIAIPQIQIAQVQCGNQFTILLTTGGLLYSFGKNKYGQLGQGHTQDIKLPVCIDSLKDAGEKITSVSTGHSHVVACSGLGKVFTFGWGQYGQLGHNTFNFANEISPKQLKNKLLQNEKVIQVSAGYRASYLLTQTRKIMQFGTNSQLELVQEPKIINLTQKGFNISQSIYEPIKLQTTWSNTLSIFSVVFGNVSKAFQKQPIVKNKILSTITQNWVKHGTDLIDPPFYDKIGNYLSERNMKMNLNTTPKIEFESKKYYNQLQSEISQNKNYQKQKQDEKILKENNRKNLFNPNTKIDIDKNNQSNDYDVMSFQEKNSFTQVQEYTENILYNKKQFYIQQQNNTPDNNFDINKNNNQYAQQYEQIQNIQNSINMEDNNNTQSEPSISLDTNRIVNIREIRNRLQEVQNIPQNQRTQQDIQFIQIAQQFDFDELEKYELTQQASQKVQNKLKYEQHLNEKLNLKKQIQEQQQHQQYLLQQQQLQEQQLQQQNQIQDDDDDNNNTNEPNQYQNNINNNIITNNNYDSFNPYTSNQDQQIHDVNNNTNSNQSEINNNSNNNKQQQSYEQNNKDNINSKNNSGQFNNINDSQKDSIQNNNNNEINQHNSIQNNSNDNNYSNQYQSSNISISEQYKFKLIEIKKKYDFLMNELPQSDWNENDQEFIKLAQSPQIFQQIQQL